MEQRKKKEGVREERGFPDPQRGKEIVEHLRTANGGDIKMSTEEIMRMTRGEDWGTGHLEEGDGKPR
jgi:hypothetical protein